MTDTSVVRLVVRILGILGGIGIVGLIFLTYRLLTLVTVLSADDVALFAAVIGAVGVVGTLTGSVVGVIGGLLISTRSGDTSGVAKAEGRAELAEELNAAVEGEPLEVVVKNEGEAEAIPVKENKRAR